MRTATVRGGIATGRHVRRAGRARRRPGDGEPLLRGVPDRRRRTPARRHVHGRRGRDRRAGGRRPRGRPRDPVRRVRREPPDARNRQVGGDPGRHLHPHHGHDARRSGRGAHDPAQADPDGRRADPAGIPPHADRRRRRGVARHPGRGVPCQHRAKRVRSPAVAAGGRAARGVPVARDLPHPEARRRRRRDPAAARPVRRGDRGAAVGERRGSSA